MHEAIIELNEHGYGKITIDGIVIPARKLHIESEVGKPAILTVELVPMKTKIKCAADVTYTEEK